MNACNITVNDLECGNVFRLSNGENPDVFMVIDLNPAHIEIAVEFHLHNTNFTKLTPNHSLTVVLNLTTDGLGVIAKNTNVIKMKMVSGIQVKDVEFAMFG